MTAQLLFGEVLEEVCAEDLAHRAGFGGKLVDAGDHVDAGERTHVDVQVALDGEVSAAQIEPDRAVGSRQRWLVGRLVGDERVVAAIAQFEEHLGAQRLDAP